MSSSSLVVYHPDSCILSIDIDFPSFTPPPPPREYKYDLFLSFKGEDTRSSEEKEEKRKKGEDTRDNFVDHLFKELRRMGIHCYIDEKKLQIGKEIEQSRFSIVVLSKNYASSRKCLNQLVKILECKATTSTTSAVYPVFYHVDPSDVRNQAGDFGKGLQKLLSQNDTIDIDEINMWRDALKKVSNLKGWVYPPPSIVRSEAKFIEELVQDIFSSLDLRYSGVTEYLVGMNSRVKKVIELLDLELDEARVIEICGEGGSGKTTIAKAVCDRISWQFEGCSFIENVRKTSKTKRGLKRLQEKLISDLLRGVDPKVGDIDQGRTMIENAIGCKKVLIVLDDVVSLVTLIKLVGDRFFLWPNFRVIMTKRDQEISVEYKVKGYKAKAKAKAEAEVRRIFKQYEAEKPKNAKVEKLRIFKQYEVEKLKKDEAIDLFMKAYGKDQPTGGFEEVLDRAVEYAKGIPLALQVLGSFLKGRSKGECVRLLSSTYELVEQITILHRKKIFKHDLINLLGWNIGKRSGWDEAQEEKHRREKEQQVVIDQEEKLRKGKEQLDGNKYLLGTGSFTRLPGPALWPNLKYLRDVSLVYCTQCQLLDFCYISRHLVFLEILCVSQNLATQQLDSWLSLPNLRVLMLAKSYFPEAFPETTKLPSSSISQLDHLHTTDEFMMVDRFRIDDFSFLAPFLGCYLTITPGHLKVRIESLQYIFEWMILDKSASLKCLESKRHSFSTPSSRPGLPLEQLEVLSFRNSVPHCRELMHKENVFLENLEINGCSSMSFPIKSKLATNLRQLKITNCTSLQTLPVGLIHNNSSLEMLHIQGCPSLISFPESEPSSPDSASNTFLKLTKLEIWDCVKLKSLPLSLHQFFFLSILSISNCPCLVSFPEGGLPSDLTSLLIYECESLRFLPDNMHKLASLQVLSINGCPSLTFFPEGGLPTNLVSLSVIDCENLCPLYQWQLHKLIKLEQFTVMGVCSHLDL